jgi:hypothetical protein
VILETFLQELLATLSMTSGRHRRRRRSNFIVAVVGLICVFAVDIENLALETVLGLIMLFLS